MLLKIEPSGGTHAKEPTLQDNEVIVCNNAQEEALAQRATNKTCFFCYLKDVKGKNFSLGLEHLLVDHPIPIHYLDIL